MGDDRGDEGGVPLRRAFARASLERSSLEALKGIFHFLGVFAQEALPDRQIVN